MTSFRACSQISLFGFSIQCRAKSCSCSEVSESFLVLSTDYCFFFSSSFFVRCGAKKAMWSPVEDCRPAERLSIMLQEKRVRRGKRKGKDGNLVQGCRVARGVKRLTVQIPFLVPTDAGCTNPQPCRPMVQTILSSVAKVRKRKKFNFNFTFSLRGVGGRRGRKRQGRTNRA